MISMVSKKDLDKVWNHIEVTNKEMGEVKENVATMKTDIKWLKESMERVDRRTWYIATGILITVIISVGTVAIQLVS